MGTLLFLVTACNSGSSEEKTVNVRLSECLRATLEPGQYMTCAEAGIATPPRTESLSLVAIYRRGGLCR